ncbi:hypothetical protein D3C71_77600 [compost metagenome]
MLDKTLSALALRATLGNEAWMRANVHKLREIFPVEWTKMDQQQILQLLFQLKLVGIEWSHESQIPQLMEFFSRVKIGEQKVMPGNVIWIRRVPVAGAPPRPPAPPPPTPHQQSVQEFMDRLAKNRKQE